MLVPALVYALVSYVLGVFVARAMFHDFATDPKDDDVPFVGFVFLLSPVTVPLFLVVWGAAYAARALGRAVTVGQ
jgi:hypothetical protein